MPPWFEIAVVILLASMAVSAIDLCFCFENISRNLAVALQLIGKSTDTKTKDGVPTVL
jgi:hypothetical protein